MRINYVSAILDSSGYGNAARNYVAALDSLGVEVHVVPLSFEDTRPDLGKLGELVKGIAVRNVNSESKDITIIHATPNILGKLARPDTYNIAYCAWETDCLPPDWAAEINKSVQELWVPCNRNVSAFKKGGVTVPIIVVPHCFNSAFTEITTSPIITGSEYKFLSIFQFAEKKNPYGLVKAYVTEFLPEEPVSLTIKTFVKDAANPQEAEGIRASIKQMKDSLHMASFPKINLITSLLSGPEVNRLYIDSNCYVTLHRGEGFSIPCVESLLAGKPVIATDWSGTEDYITTETGYPVPCMTTPVFGMPYPQYTGKQNWAEPSLPHAKALMREVYLNREDAVEKALVGKKYVQENLSWSKIGGMMVNRLEEIMKTRVS